MPQLKGTKTHTYPLSYEGVLDSWTFIPPKTIEGRYESKRRKVEGLYKVCSKIAKDILDHNYYFVGFYDYKFYKFIDTGEGAGECGTMRYKFLTLNREFNNAPTIDERDYWGRVYTERMVYELAGHLGLEDCQKGYRQ